MSGVGWADQEAQLRICDPLRDASASQSKTAALGSIDEVQPGFRGGLFAYYTQQMRAITEGRELQPNS